MIPPRRIAQVAALVWLATASMAGAAAQTARAPSTIPAGLNPMRAVPRESLRSFVEQPLFDPSRRLPPALPPAAASPPLHPSPVLPEPPPVLHLLGVVGGDDVVAVVQTAGGKTSYLRNGDRVGQWTVRVLPTGLRIRSGERIFDYDLFTLPGSGHGPVAVDPKRVGFAPAPVGFEPSTLAARGNN